VQEQIAEIERERKQQRKRHGRFEDSEARIEQ
jgi:hypothetical protein